jgi:hypothetical protein
MNAFDAQPILQAINADEIANDDIMPQLMTCMRSLDEAFRDNGWDQERESIQSYMYTAHVIEPSRKALMFLMEYDLSCLRKHAHAIDTWLPLFSSYWTSDTPMPLTRLMHMDDDNADNHDDIIAAIRYIGEKRDVFTAAINLDEVNDNVMRMVLVWAELSAAMTDRLHLYKVSNLLNLLSISCMIRCDERLLDYAMRVPKDAMTELLIMEHCHMMRRDWDTQQELIV